MAEHRIEMCKACKVLDEVWSSDEDWKLQGIETWLIIKLKVSYLSIYNFISINNYNDLTIYSRIYLLISI